MAKLEKAVARRWARAVIGLAQEKDALDKVGQDLDTLASLMDGHKELRHALLSPSFKPEQRANVMMAIADSIPGLHAVTRSVIRLLNDKGRVRYLPLIAVAFRQEADRLLGRVRASVESAVPLEKAELEAISEALKKQVLNRKLGKDVVVTTAVNAELLSGVRASMGGLVFDGSLKSHLRRIGQQLSA